jgi:hypothetical protein
MSTNVVMFAWNRAIPGRERTSAEHFAEFLQYLGGLQAKGSIQAFDPVFLDAHGGDMNGFFLIRGDTAKLQEVVASEAWVTHVTRATLHLEGAGVVRGVTGDLLMQRMALWTKLLP